MRFAGEVGEASADQGDARQVRDVVGSERIGEDMHEELIRKAGNRARWWRGAFNSGGSGLDAKAGEAGDEVGHGERFRGLIWLLLLLLLLL